MPFNQTGRISRAIVAVAGKSFRLADYFSGLLDVKRVLGPLLLTFRNKSELRTKEIAEYTCHS
jgi:hypothetical protein